MKKTIAIMMTIAFVIGLGGLALAEDKVTPQEIVDKVRDAAKLIGEKGDSAFVAIKDKNGPFMWKNNYLFVLSYDGTMLMHPVVAKLEGRNMSKIKDIKGKLFNIEMVQIAQSEKGEGWLDYYWPKPGTKEPVLKVGFVKAVPGKSMFVGSGMWDISLEEAKAQSK